MGGRDRGRRDSDERRAGNNAEGINITELDKGREDKTEIAERGEHISTYTGQYKQEEAEIERKGHRHRQKGRGTDTETGEPRVTHTYKERYLRSVKLLQTRETQRERDIGRVTQTSRHTDRKTYRHTDRPTPQPAQTRWVNMLDNVRA